MLLLLYHFKTFPTTILRDDILVSHPTTINYNAFKSPYQAHYLLSFRISIGLLRQKLLLLQFILSFTALNVLFIRLRQLFRASDDYPQISVLLARRKVDYFNGNSKIDRLA